MNIIEHALEVLCSKMRSSETCLPSITVKEDKVPPSATAVFNFRIRLCTGIIIFCSDPVFEI